MSNAPKPTTRVTKLDIFAIASVCGILVFAVVIYLINRNSASTAVQPQFSPTTASVNPPPAIDPKETDRVVAEAEKLLEPLRIQKRMDRIVKRHPDWLEGDCLKLAKGETWVGMDIDMLHESMGLPDHVNKTEILGSKSR